MEYSVTIFFVLLIVVLWFITTGNTLARKKIKIEESLSGIEVALTKRYDTLVKMRDVAKNYALHEKEVLLSVVQLRSGMKLTELEQANSDMDKISSNLNLLAEAYPTLRSDSIYVELQKGIRDTEEHLQAARRLYNANVSSYNTVVRVFPSSIVAKLKGLCEETFFKADEHKREDVTLF